MTEPTAKPLSQAAYDRLKAELEDLTTAGRKDMAERLMRARELGDLSENAEYHETKNAQGLMEARIRTLQATLRDATIVTAPVDADVAIAGTIVGLRPIEGGDVEHYLLAASSEERSPKVLRTVTLESPLGGAIGGKAIGDKVTYEAPGGTFTYEVVELSPWDGS